MIEMRVNQNIEIWGFHSSEDDDDVLLGFGTM
jgi:hypothetical protein